jgi:predicted nucleic acid-binding protein
VDAFDSDVLIYAAVPGHPLGRRVRALLTATAPGASPSPLTAVGSVLLVAELLTKPTREGMKGEVRALAMILARLDLRPVDAATADLAVALGASYRLKPIDAVHLATAVALGADRFVTNNRKDFSARIHEIDVTYPTDLPDPRPDLGG